MKLIDKDALVTKIKSKLSSYERKYTELAHYEVWGTANEIDNKIEELKGILSLIDTLEVKEADLKKEIDNVWNPHFNLGWDDNSLVSINHKSFESIAKHFFELGLKVQKGE